jgi:hypothetical protein
MSGSVAGTRLETALSLLDTGVDLVRCRARREHPEASDSQIEVMVQRWLDRDVGHVVGRSARYFHLRDRSSDRR